MTPAQAWRTLGIAATGETRAIRQAYAAKLRALDVDADRDGFAALREARDIALQLAGMGAAVELDEAPASASAEPGELRVPADVMRAPVLALTEDEGRVAASPAEPRADFYPSDRAAVPATGPSDAPVALSDASLRAPTLDLVSAGTISLGSNAEKFDLHYRAIHDLLLPQGVEEPGPLTHDERVVLGAHIDAVLHDPRLDEVSFYGDVSRWFANTLARACPRSDPILASVAAHFGWMADADKVGQDPAVAFVTRRQRTLDFLEAVQQPAHRLNSAWRELTRPSNEHSGRSWGVSRTKVNELLATVRRDYPDLEGALDWHRVNLWENRYNWGKTAWPIGLIAFVLLRLFLAIPAMNHEPAMMNVDATFSPPATTSTVLSSETADIDVALSSIYGDELDSARVSARNPALDKDLRALWGRARDKGEDRIAFRHEVVDMLSDHVRRGIRHAGYALIADYRRSDLTAIRWLARIGAGPCADYLAGRGNAEDVPEAVRARKRALHARILLEADTSGSTPAKQGSFRIPEPVFDDAAKRAHLPLADMRRALNFEGPEPKQCEARFALIEAALAAQQDAGLKLLREM